MFIFGTGKEDKPTITLEAVVDARLLRYDFHITSDRDIGHENSK